MTHLILKRARTCGDCRAYDPVSHGCEIGFKTKSTYDIKHELTRTKPLEPCYKPKNIHDLISATQFRRDRS